MNPHDLPRELTHEATADELMDAVRAVAQGPLAAVVESIDREGHYPRAVLQQLGALGALGAHLDAPAGRGDYGLAIRARPRSRASAVPPVSWCGASWSAACTCRPAATRP